MSATATFGTGFANGSCTATVTSRAPRPPAPMSIVCGVTVTRDGARGKSREHEIGFPVHLDAVRVRDLEIGVAGSGARGNREGGAAVSIGVRVELRVRPTGDLARAMEKQTHAGEAAWVRDEW